MPFTIDQLRYEMSQAMVSSGMLSDAQFAQLMDKENSVNAAVNALETRINWLFYWNDLGRRLTGFGGNIKQPTASPSFGLSDYPGDSMGLIAILNDCFDDTWRHMQKPGFDAHQALANHIFLLRSP